MSVVKIYPSKLKGEMKIPPSKSLSNRAIICGALAEDISDIDNLIFSDDIKVTLNGMRSLGTNIECIECASNQRTYCVTLKGNPDIRVLNRDIDCKESGSTLRFLIPFAGVAGDEMIFTGRGKLVERPLNTYYRILPYPLEVNLYLGLCTQCCSPIVLQQSRMLPGKNLPQLYNIYFYTFDFPLYEIPCSPYFQFLY